MVFCSGKVYFDLRAARRERGIKDIAMVRIEQLYPFPHDDFKAEIEKYAKAKEVVWCQEEPGNQGAWHRIQHYLLRHMLPHQKLAYALRPSSASPAAGYLALHSEQQKAVHRRGPGATCYLRHCVTREPARGHEQPWRIHAG